MNETNFIPRQKFILNIISQSKGLWRGEIQKKIGTRYQISKPTIIRDLDNLIRKNLIRTEGKGKNTKYFPYSKNPLLKPFDIDLYFADEPDKRINAKKSFDFSVFNHLNELFSSVEKEEINEFRESFNKQVKKLSPDIFKKELERFVIELAWKSSKIEGNTYSLLETESLIKEQKTAFGKTKEEAIMILDHKSAFDMILVNKNDFKTISVSKVNQLHNILVKDLDITTGVRKQAVGITGTTYQPLDNEHQIKEAYEKIVVIINKNENIFEKSLIAHFMISYIQPYSDGNKRTARMLTNAIFLADDLYPLSYRSVNEDEFKKALILFYEQGSIYKIKKLFIEQLKFANETYFR